MRAQRIKVNTKRSLIAAIECARCCEVYTHITLTRKTGTSEYIFFPSEYTIWSKFAATHKKHINQTKSRIRRIPEKELLT